ncbi:TetR/AcrR family transcriptional regulator [Halopseudomonas laoshanensis]|uniref:TetR/AcrR family transcriptional regulator n=1 Tax=Halopseudomonas laoshanensis TaxID=2268758 RepID=A0A7V7GT37_9GAMM|nr:TetR/AcrR family transcriptional regulator [Halopseudomonas laoshanensis]KAA0694225.1 TetR/AcrR family transcriptional regulator [Halopseudomonas laoshanensis]
MGHSRASKQQSHEHIVSTAAKRFRESGVDGVSIANLMKEAGLTHGGFYKHFTSRDDLVTEALEVALASSRKRYSSGGDAAFESFVTGYLSIKHRDNPGEGCAVAALANDIPRARGDSKALFTTHLERSFDWIADLLGAEHPDARARAIVAFSTMVGALGFARALDNEALSQEVLDTVKDYLLRHLQAE